MEPTSKVSSRTAEVEVVKPSSKRVTEGNVNSYWKTIKSATLDTKNFVPPIRKKLCNAIRRLGWVYRGCGLSYKLEAGGTYSAFQGKPSS